MSEKPEFNYDAPTVKYEVEEGIAYVTMARPEYNNAQNGKMTYELDAAFRKAVADDDVKVIVLRGEGKHFSAGLDNADHCMG